MVGPGFFRQKNVIFSQSPGVSFPLPHTAGMPRVLTLQFSPWVLILQPELLEHPFALQALWAG